MKNFLIAFLLACAACGTFFSINRHASVLSAEDSTVVVMGNTASGVNQPGWLFNRDTSTDTPFEFNTNAASIGVGSLYVLPIGANASDKFIAENFINSPMASVESVSYDFKIGSGGEESDKVHFYMNVYSNFGVSSDDKFYDCRYNVIPTVGSTSGFTTVTFDPTLAYPVTQHATSPFSCPSIPANMDLINPNSTIRMFALNVGDTSVNDLGLDGYLDKVVVKIDDDIVTYDFEPALKPTSKEQCNGEGWKTFNAPAFKNQGDCVSFVQSNENAKGNKTK